MLYLEGLNIMKKPSIKPDLLVIDGGKTQLKFVQNIIKNSSFKDIKVISIVKGLNRVRATETIISFRWY